MHPNVKHRRVLWFLIGLGTELQILASLTMTEFFCLVAAPFLFFKTLPSLRRHGIMPFFTFSLLVIVGCMISCYINHTPPGAVLRGSATACILPCAILVGHWLICKDANGLKWFLLGWILSLFISTFVFQASSAVTMLGGSPNSSISATEYMSGALYWINRVQAILLYPSQALYLQTPISLDVICALAAIVFMVATSETGRSASLGLLGFIMLVVLGGKCQRTMRRMSRHFFLLCFLAICGIFLAKTAYSVAAMQGWLNEKQIDKYETQTQTGNSVLDLLIGGRKEFFVGLSACLERPLVGFGPWARDTMGYYERFILRYGSREEQQQYIRVRNNPLMRERLLVAHSFIIQFWEWFGIFGLVFWLYVIYVLLRHVRQDCWVVPQWYAWVTCSMPALFWNIFFSPFQSRFTNCLIIVACLMARAVRCGTFILPDDMQREILKNELKHR